ncbi:hypothetical protein GCM10011328_09100 [Hafnia psychrotolerans]|uniref:Transposase n=1 Tax=Hafnia psychrotolerans TaxID=1477018 RepID=A0ABQ1G3N2_9GAMM|nr:hypothetical protein GCM10011328_09100 [Hafnia psychrotolerans]
MDPDNLLLLEEQNLLRRSKIFTGSQRTKFALTEAIKNLLNVSGREADLPVIKFAEAIMTQWKYD